VGARRTLRWRFCEPEPHDSVQVDQAEKSPSTQSIGHACVLHVSVSVVAAQSAPPNLGACSTARLRERYPVPQVWLHSLSWVHAPSLQSCGWPLGVSNLTLSMA
jgi:hypothetical protein